VSSIAVPDATSTIKGKLQLAGDLSGTASSPSVANLAITNAKLANLSSSSNLKGSSSSSAVATDITLGPGLNMNASSLTVQMTIVQTATNYLVTIGNSIIEVTNTSSSRTITLPSPAVTNTGQRIIVKDTSGGAGINGIVVNTVSGTIDGQASLTISVNYGSIEIYSDGTNWYSTGVVSSPAYVGYFAYGATGGVIVGINTQPNVQPWNIVPVAGRINFSTWTQQGVSSNINVSTNTVTITKAGLYTILFSSIFGGSSTGTGNPFAQIIQNSTKILGLTRITGNIVYYGGNISWTGYLNVGDIIDFRTGIDINATFGLYSAGFYISQVPSVASSAVITNNPVNYVAFTGGITYPTLTGIGVTTITYTAFTAYVRYNNSGVDTREIWTYPGGVYTPTWPNGTNQQATYIAFVPDYTTSATTKSLKIIEYAYYRNFQPNEVGEIIFYTIATRDTTTTFFTSFVSYMQGYSGNVYSNKIQTFYNGSTLLYPRAYRITPESSNVGSVVGTYFRIDVGSAITAGRNYLNDPFQSYTISNDLAISGAASNMTVTVAGRGTLGNEGEQFFRVTGSTAKIFGSATFVPYEPVNATSTASYVTVPVNKWTFYKLVVLPGSRIIVVQPHNDASFNSAATTIVATHIYDTAPYNTYDRWIPSVHVGYMAISGNLNLNTNWSSNIGNYAFYDKYKVQYA
jgi:hypothetical protein